MPSDPARTLYPPLGRALSDYAMITTEEPILLGISGGKDSLLLAYLLSEMRNRSPVKFSLSAITVDPGEPIGFTDEALLTMEGYLAGLGISHHVVKTGIARIVSEHSQDESCSLCANLRRGTIYKKARELGFRTVALAHHLDDAIETLFLNMFYQSALRCFEPKTFLSRREVTVIRPLIYIPEPSIQKVTERLGLPVIPTRCPVSGTTNRQRMKELILRLSGQIPGFHSHMKAVLKKIWL